MKCPTALVCYAFSVNNDPYSIYVTTNGGKAWSDSTGVWQQADDMACPSSSTCFGGLGNEIERTTNGGIDWSKVSMPAGANSITSISCPTTSVCYAANYNSEVYVTADGGTSWTTEAIPGNTFAISCPSVSTCFVDDYGYLPGTTTSSGMVAESIDAGATWSQQEVPSGTGSLVAISCPLPGACFTSGQNEQVGTLVLKLQLNSSSTTENISPPSVKEGQVVTFSVSVTGSGGAGNPLPTGTVTFTTASATLCTVTLSNKAPRPASRVVHLWESTL